MPAAKRGQDGSQLGSELSAGGGSLRRSARLQHQPPSQTTQPSQHAVEDTAVSQRTVTKRITGRTPKLLQWDAATTEAEATASRRIVSASAPARKRGRTSEARQHAASAPAAAAALHDTTGAASNSEAVTAAAANGRRSRDNQHIKAAAAVLAAPTVRDLPLLQGAQTPGSAPVRRPEASRSQRYRSVSAIHNAGRGNRTEAAPNTEPLPAAASRSGRSAQRAVIVVRGDFQVVPSPAAAPPSAQLPVRRSSRAADHGRALEAAPCSRLCMSEVDGTHGFPVPKGHPTRRQVACSVLETQSATGAASAIADGANGMRSSAAGSRAKVGKRRTVPEPLAQAFIPVVAADTRGNELDDAQLARGEQQPDRPEMDVAQLDDDQTDGGAISAGSVSSEDDDAPASPGHVGAGDSDGASSADDSDAFLEALASRMLAAAASEDEESEDDAVDGSQQEERRPGLPEQDDVMGQSVEHADEEVDLDEAAFRWEPETGLPSPLDLGDAAAGLAGAARREQGLAKAVTAPPRDSRVLAKEARKRRKDTAGRGWFDLPATQITDEVKRDLRMLRLRGAFDPKRFYKSADATKFPKYFHMGTVVEGPTDFYSGRLARKERKRTFTEELMSDAALKQSHKRRFDRLQAERQRWRHKKIRHTSNERLNKRKPRPKH